MIINELTPRQSIFLINAYISAILYHFYDAQY
jgi:hypothetical protein